MKMRFKPGDTAWAVREDRIVGFVIMAVDCGPKNVYCLDVMGEAFEQDKLFRTKQQAETQLWGD